MNKLLLLLSVLLVSTWVSAQTGPAGLALNDKAPDFTAKDQNGQSFHLQEQLKKGPVVLVFYRGQWCPFCNRQLKKLEDSLSFITGKGASLVAVSPEIMENIEKTIKKTKATYPVVHDDGMKIMKAYDVLYDVDDATIKRYQGYGLDFNKANGEDIGNRLPVPALYVIKKDGTIAFRHFDPDYRKRPSVAEILQHL